MAVDVEVEKITAGSPYGSVCCSCWAGWADADHLSRSYAPGGGGPAGSLNSERLKIKEERSPAKPKAISEQNGAAPRAAAVGLVSPQRARVN